LAANFRPTRGCISPYNIDSFICNVSEEVVTKIAKNCRHRHRQPHCYLTPVPWGTLANVCIHVIFSETKSLGYIRLAAVASEICELAQNSVTICTNSSSRPSKVIDFSTNRKRTYDFLLVINSDYGPCTVSEIRRLNG